LCLFSHNGHRALSITCNPTFRPKVLVYFLRTYILIRTLKPSQSVPRGTLYVQHALKKNGAGRRLTGPDERLILLRNILRR
jgi:hypothetical protein